MYEADRALVTRMAAGEQRAFDEFFHLVTPRLAAFVGRRSELGSMSVEDIVQNTLIKAVRNLASYRGDAALSTWLTQICRHELADAYRKAARQPGHESLDVLGTARRVTLRLRIPDKNEPPAEIDAQLRRNAIIQALNAIPAHYAYALEAKYGDGLSVEEMAQVLGLTPIAVQSLLARARAAFRERWYAASGGTKAESGQRD